MTDSKPATPISQLKANQTATVHATVVSLEATREIPSNDGSTRKVRNANLKDQSGAIVFTLWAGEVDMVAEGDHVLITDGWVKDYKGKAQISLGRSGKLTKVPDAPA